MSWVASNRAATVWVDSVPARTSRSVRGVVVGFLRAEVGMTFSSPTASRFPYHETSGASSRLLLGAAARRDSKETDTGSTGGFSPDGSWWSSNGRVGFTVCACGCGMSGEGGGDRLAMVGGVRGYAAAPVIRGRAAVVESVESKPDQENSVTRNLSNILSSLGFLFPDPPPTRRKSKPDQEL